MRPNFSGLVFARLHSGRLTQTRLQIQSPDLRLEAVFMSTNKLYEIYYNASSFSWKKICDWDCVAFAPCPVIC